MKNLIFRQQGKFPIPLNTRILKFWNPIACSVHLALHPITTQSPQRGRVKVGGGSICVLNLRVLFSEVNLMKA